MTDVCVCVGGQSTVGSVTPGRRFRVVLKISEPMSSLPPWSLL